MIMFNIIALCLFQSEENSICDGQMQQRLQEEKTYECAQNGTRRNSVARKFRRDRPERDGLQKPGRRRAPLQERDGREYLYLYVIPPAPASRPHSPQHSQ